jgi:NAD(P)H dehydrogenase (quinone)
MDKIKTLIVYYSSTGANYQLAQWADECANKSGAETRIRKVQELAPAAAISSNPAWKKHTDATSTVAVATLEDLEWADVIVFSAPTRYGNVPAQMKQFLDSTGPLWSQGKLANKIVTAMSSAMNVHGGQEATILSLYTTMYHWGALVVAPGYTDPVLFSTGGNPYGASATVDDKGKMKEDIRPAVEHQVKRAITIALWLKKGSTNNESVNENSLQNELSHA